SDSLHGSCIVYGQVASGANWRGKPIKSFITGRFFDWFDDRPSEQYIAALFIPFPIHEQVTERKGYSFEEVLKETARAYELDFGMIVDRLRLTELVYGTAQVGPDPEEFRKWGLAILR